MKKIITVLTICSPLLMHAQGFQVNLQGQKQQGMGGTGSAFIQDASALFFNPGGASFLKENSVSIGVSPVLSHAKFADGASSTISETNSPASYPFTAYALFGKKDSKLKYGVAAYTPFGSVIEWQDGWTGRFALTRMQLQSIFIQPTVSYKINDQFGIGAGFVYGTGKMNIRRDIPVADNSGKFGKAELDGKAQGYGFNAGVYYKPTSQLSFGLNYRSEVNMKVKDGSATFTVPQSLQAGFPATDFAASLPLPKTIVLGVAYSPIKKLTIAFDAAMVGWKSFDTLTFDYATNTPTLADTKSSRNYQNTSAFRLGGQYNVTSKFDVRAGIKYLKSPIKDGYVSPDVPDADHVSYSLGVGYKFNSHFTVDASFTYESMSRTDTNLESQLNGTYKTNIYIPGISINYNF
jgi:long-chain fatty acid transport protein